MTNTILHRNTITDNKEEEDIQDDITDDTDNESIASDVTTVQQAFSETFLILIRLLMLLILLEIFFKRLSYYIDFEQIRSMFKTK